MAKGNVQGVWNNSYTSINNCNGVLEFASQAGIPVADQTRLIAEAKFMRAYYYFMLVQTFGPVSILTKFANEANTAATREPIAAVYDLIVKDLTDAITDLPVKPTPTQGRAGKAAAINLLAKVYLTRGWSSAAKASDFTDAYNTALQLINNKAAVEKLAGKIKIQIIPIGIIKYFTTDLKSTNSLALTVKTLAT